MSDITTYRREAFLEQLRIKIKQIASNLQNIQSEEMEVIREWISEDHLYLYDIFNEQKIQSVANSIE
jgi:hypothetical protein